jgi:hypothetical protein
MKTALEACRTPIREGGVIEASGKDHIGEACGVVGEEVSSRHAKQHV